MVNTPDLSFGASACRFESDRAYQTIKSLYVAEDGKEFNTQDEAIAHEKELVRNTKRYENLNIYTIRHGFDATEGRGYYATTYVITDARFSVVLDYCFDTFGKILRSWYLYSYYAAWEILKNESITIDTVMSSDGKVPSYGHSKTTVVFISQAGEIDGLPKPMFPWPKGD